MDYSQLENYTYAELAKLATDMDLKVHRSKSGLVQEITNAFKEYEAYKRDKIDKYTKVKQLSKRGAENIVYLVTTKGGTEYVMKTFHKQKSSTSLHREAELQKAASDCGAAPNIVDEDTVSKYIVMERMDRHLFSDNIHELSVEQQKQIISIYKSLDKAKVFHGDVNLDNYMYRGDRLYIIDFGKAREITTALVEKLGTNTPNMTLNMLSFVLKLREMGYPATSYEYLMKYISPEQRSQYGLVPKVKKSKV